jgi:hypothetical protein
MRWTAVVIPFSIIGVIAYWNFNSRAHFRDGLPLRFDKTIHNFGEVSWGAPVEVTFRFFNASQQEVVIENITSSCACTVANLSSLRFRPGEFGVLTVRFLPTGFVGHVNQMLQIYLKGFRNPINLCLQADVNPLLMPSPSKIDFGRIEPWRQKSIMLLLKNTSGRKVRITRLETSREYVKACVVREGDEPAIRVALVHPPAGKIYERLYIYTSLPERPFIDVPIRAEVTCKWQLSDTEFFFGFANKGEQLIRRLIIKGLYLSSIKRAWSDCQLATVSVIPHQAGVEVSVKLDLRKAEGGEEIKGDIYIETTDSKQPFLRLPIIGFVQNPDREVCCGKDKKVGEDEP